MLSKGVGTAGFNPNQLTGLKAWFDPTFGLYQEINSTTTPSAVNDPVGTWVPQFGPQANSRSNSVRPSLKSLNGFNRLLADGIDDIIEISDATFLSTFSGDDKPYTIACWFQLVTVAQANCLNSFCSTLATNQFSLLQTLVTPSYQRNRRDDAGVNNSSNDGTPNTSAHSSILTYDGTAMNHYVDGSAVGSALTITTGVCTFTRLGFFALARAAPSSFASAYLGNIIVLDHAASAGEIASMNTFLLAN